jgi:Zonular occludens toxin (Zot)
MPVYIFTGKLGGGKTLCSVGRIKEKLQAGCIVATNLNLNLNAMFPANSRQVRVMRIPDKPKIDDMYALGCGNDTYDENQNGLIVLDECGTWFNSRNWNDKERKPVNDWFLHARKLGWDLILIIQDIKLLDSQARDALAEHTVFCKRLDRITIPYLGFLFKTITGKRIAGPRIHVARCVYGTAMTDLVADRWIYKGNDLFKCYDTKQLFLDDYPHRIHSLLTPWHLKGRYAVLRNKDFYMRMTRIYFKRYSKVGTLAAGIFLGIMGGVYLNNMLNPKTEPVAVQQADQEKKAEEPAPVKVEPPKPKEPVSELFASYKLVTYLQSATRTIYTISDGGTSYTDEQLKSLGYLVTVQNNCELRINRRENWQDVAVIFADNCIVKPYNEPALDLSTIPSLEAVAYQDG